MLEDLFIQKLASQLPGAKLVTNPVEAGSGNDPAALYIQLGKPDGKSADFWCVELPGSVYGHWNHTGLQLLLEEILKNCELQLAFAEQKSGYEAYLDEVRSTKEKLLPHTSYLIEGLQYARHYVPTIGGGGDYFDIVDLRNARKRTGFDRDDIFWGASLLDVSGHGPGAAVEVAMIDAILRTYQGGPGKGPGDVLTYVNRHFFTRQGRGGYVTGIICTFDAGNGEFRYANAGHLPILVKNRQGEIFRLDDHGGIPVGIDREFEWETLSVRLESGDSLLMMTDGITEARSQTGHEFGMTSVETLFREIPHQNPDDFLNLFLEEFRGHVGDNEIKDDQTLIVITLNH